jgi:hypothetical protein
MDSSTHQTDVLPASPATPERPPLPVAVTAELRDIVEAHTLWWRLLDAEQQRRQSTFAKRGVPEYITRKRKQLGTLHAAVAVLEEYDPHGDTAAALFGWIAEWYLPQRSFPRHRKRNALGLLLMAVVVARTGIPDVHAAYHARGFSGLRGNLQSDWSRTRRNREELVQQLRAYQQPLVTPADLTALAAMRLPLRRRMQLSAMYSFFG